MKLQGKAWKFGDDVNTDLILPGKYLELTDPSEMAGHAMEGIDRTFPQRIKAGDIVVAGRNFGCGSSREHAPLALKYAGVGAIISESYARIFYRNSINIGLPALESKGVLKAIDAGDSIKIDLKGGSIRNVTKSISIRFIPLPVFMIEVLEMGGLAAYLKRHIEEW